MCNICVDWALVLWRGSPWRRECPPFSCSFLSIQEKPFFSSLYNSWFLTNWSDLPDLKNREWVRKDGTENSGSIEVYQRTGEMEFGNESGNSGVEGRHAGPQRDKRNVVGHQERGQNVWGRREIC